jgi:hypothetical protein
LDAEASRLAAGDVLDGGADVTQDLLSAFDVRGSTPEEQAYLAQQQALAAPLLPSTSFSNLFQQVGQTYTNAQHSVGSTLPGFWTADIDEATANDLRGQGFTYDPLTGRWLPPAGYAGSQADFEAGVQMARQRVAAQPVQAQPLGQPSAPATPLERLNEWAARPDLVAQRDVWAEQARQANVVSQQEAMIAALDPANQNAMLKAELEAGQQKQIQAWSDSLGGGPLSVFDDPLTDAANAVKGAGLGALGAFLNSPMIYSTSTVGGQGGPTQVRPIGDTVTPIPALESFQENIERQLGRVPVAGKALGLASELFLPTSPLDVAMIPTGVGLAGDVADVGKLASGAVRAGANVVQPLIREGLNPEANVVRLAVRQGAVAPVLEDSMAAATGAMRVVDPSGVRVLGPDEAVGAGESVMFHGTAGPLRGGVVEPGTWLTPNPTQAESYARSASVLGRREPGILRQLATSELGAARIPGGDGEDVFVRYKYTNPGPAGPYTGSLTVKGPVKKGTVIKAPFGDAEVVSATRATPVDTRRLPDLQREALEVGIEPIPNGKPLTRQQLIHRIGQARQALQPSAAPSPAAAVPPSAVDAPASKMTPESVSAIRRRQKGGTEIPVTQDPMAPKAPARAPRGAKAAAGGTTPPVEPPASVATLEPPPSPPPPPTGTGSGGEDFAGNIRLSKYPEDIRDSIKGWADANPDVVQNARRGTIPDAQVKDMARDLVNDLGGNFEKIERGWKPGQAWNAEEITAIRGALNDSTKRVMEMAEAARRVDSTENQLKLTEAILRQQRIQQVVHGVTAEAGRSLRAFRQQAAEALADKNIARMQELMRHALNGKGEQDITNIAEMIRALDLDDPTAVNTFLRNVNKPGMGDYLYEVWINSVLSGPITHLRNIFGNAAATMYSPIERLGAVPVESVAARLTGRQAERYWQEAPASMLGMAHGLPEGVRGAIDVLRQGFNASDVGRLEIRRTAFTGKAGRVIRFPTNMLEAMDSFFHAVNYRSSLYGDAVRQARKEGHSDVALRNRIAELINEPTTQMVKHSSDEAERLLFRDDPGKMANWLMQGRNVVPGLKYVLPFIKTPANLLKYGVKHSPLGLFDVPMWRRLAEGSPEASDEVARTVMGSMIGTSLVAMIATGQLEITGAVPTDASERDRFYREGKLPFSVKIPGVGWTQYNQIPILDTTLTSVAAVVDGVKNGDDVTGIASNTAGIIAQSILDKSYLNGLADFFDAIADPARYAERFATRTITGFVPYSAALRQTAQSVDRTVRSPEGFEENLRAGIPGLTDTVPPRLDAFGNEAQRAQPSPLQISPDRQSAVDAELERLGDEVGFVGNSIGGYKLNREEKAAYQRMAGQFTYLLMDRALARDEYQTLDDVQKQKLLDGLVDDARDPTRDVLSAVFEDPAYQALSDSEKGQLLERLASRWEERIAEQVGGEIEPAPPRPEWENNITRYEDGTVGKFTMDPLGARVADSINTRTREFQPTSANAATMVNQVAKTLQRQGIDPNLLSIVDTRLTQNPDYPTGYYAGGEDKHAAIGSPTFAGLTGSDAYQEMVPVHEQVHAFEDHLTSAETAELAALMEKYPTQLAALGYADAEYHPGALTRYIDQWAFGYGMAAPAGSYHGIFGGGDAGLSNEYLTEAAIAGYQNRTNLSGMIPAEIINFINRMVPVVRSRAAAPYGWAKN